MLQLLLFSGLAFFVMLGCLKRTLTITLDVDWLWRVAGPAAVRIAARGISATRSVAVGRVGAVLQRIGRTVERWCGADGVFARTWSTSAMTLWVAALLAAYLLARYL